MLGDNGHVKVSHQCYGQVATELRLRDLLLGLMNCHSAAESFWDTDSEGSFLVSSIY